MAVLVQVTFLQNGLLGTCLEQISSICQCNHGSRKEVHAHSEDSHFQNPKKNTLKSTSSKSKNTLVNCHSAKPGEAHACSCSKKKGKFAELQIQSQKWIVSKETAFSPLVSLILLISPFESLSLQLGETKSLYRPPKFS